VKPDWDAVGELFHRVLDSDPAARADLLAEAPTVLSDEVTSLLRAHEAAEFLEKPLVLKPTVPGFEIIRELGSGGFATVYLARDLALSRLVALKVSRLEGEERRALARLEHAHVVRIYSETRNTIVMQYVPGGTFADLLRERRPSFGEALDRLPAEGAAFDPAALRDREKLERLSFGEGVLHVMLQLLDALEHAHRQRVLHLDVKPANILVSPYGRAYLVDFNISMRDGEARGWGGTPGFMPPEQEARGKVDERADLYALARVIERAKTGVPGIEEVLARALAPLATDRYASAREMADAIRGVLDLASARARRPDAGPAIRFLERGGFVALVAAALVPQLLGSTANYFYGALKVATALSPAQQVAYRQAMAFYNVLCYAAALSAFLAWIWPLRDAVGAVSGRRAFIRRRALAIPKAIWALTSLGWLPAIVCFPLSVGYLSGEAVAWENTVSFGVQFLLAWLIATPMSLLLSQLLIVRAFYPPLLQGEARIRETALRELAFIRAGNRILPTLAGMVPVLGAALAVLSGERDFTPERFQAFRVLVVLLIGLGIAGLVAAMKVAQATEEAIESLTSVDPLR
jgi:hypothetical protein